MAVMMAALATGCVDLGDAGEDIAEPDIVSMAKEVPNSLKADSLGLFASQVNVIVREPFKQTPTTAWLSSNAKGIALLDYAARCALTAGSVVTIRDLFGRPHSYPSQPALGVGLAPAWKVRGLTGSEEHWLMGCLLSHVNAIPVKVGISIRGAHPALAASATERAQYPYVEGAFYGRFGAAGDPDEAGTVFQYACFSHHLLAGCGNDEEATKKALRNRQCTANPACGMEIVGQCPDALGNGKHACGVNADGTFAPCYDTLSTSPNTWPSGEKYAEAVTVFLDHKPTCVEYGVF